MQAALAALVAVAAVYDWRYRRIPNWLALAGWITGFALHGLLGGWAGLKVAAGGFALGFGVYFVLYLIHAMGAGDVKLMGGVGALAGAHDWFLIFVLTAILGGVAAVFMMARKRRFRRTLWNVGYILSELIHFRAPYLTREELDVKNEKAITLPHGVAIAAGTLVALIFLAVPPVR
jgi:prepilin peptidase CpaA